jgi:hypothetical protein
MNREDVAGVGVNVIGADVRDAHLVGKQLYADDSEKQQKNEKY